MASLPPLPKIEGDVDLMLDVHTHRSVRFPNAPMNNDYGNTERLAELGAKILDLTITFCLFSKRPLLETEEIQSERGRLASAENIDDWIKPYGLKEKLRIAPSEVRALDNPEELRSFFHTYLGALYIRNGLEPIQDWISKLIDPNAEVKFPGAPNQSTQPPPPNFGYAPNPLYTPAPPVGNPPPLPSNPPPNMSSSSGMSSAFSLVTLALVNQTATQRGIQVTYPAIQQGQAHAPIWTVTCCMNGEEKGRGSGKSQKIAKEEAARQAWAAMGWGPSY